MKKSTVLDYAADLYESMSRGPNAKMNELERLKEALKLVIDDLMLRPPKNVFITEDGIFDIECVLQPEDLWEPENEGAR
jgi:hypothetical protein